MPLFWVARAEKYRPFYLRRLHSVVTLDSPVGGIPDLRYLVPLINFPFDVDALAEELQAGSRLIGGTVRAALVADVVTLGNSNQLIVPDHTVTFPTAWKPLDMPLKWDAGGPLVAEDLLPLKERFAYYHAIITSNETALEWIDAAILSDGPRWVAREEERWPLARAGEAPPPPPAMETASYAELRAAVEHATGDPLSVSSMGNAAGQRRPVPHPLPLPPRLV